MEERRTTADRRSGVERRAAPREGQDRRRGDRRALTAASLTVAGAVLLSVPSADAQIYTRKNAKGVVEATNVPDASDYRLTYPGKGRLIHSRAYRLRRSYNGEFDAHILDAASAHGVQPDFVRAIIQAESDYDHLAVSSKGAQGLMQLMPDTARRFGVRDAFDPRQNIFGGVQYLRVLLDMFGGDTELASAGYNAGENAVLRYNGVPPYRETRNYVQKVAALLSSVSAPVATALASYVPGTALLAGKQNATAEAPRAPLAAAARPAARAAKPKPRTFYRWTDEKGIVHVGSNPPSGGVTYSTIRSVD